LQATQSSWSSLEINTFVIDHICLQGSAECVGKQGVHSEWAKGTTLLQDRSRTEGRKSAGGQQSMSWLPQSGYTLKGYPIVRLLGDGCG